MDFLADYLWLIIALPLAGAVALHFGGRFLPEPLPGLAAVGALGAAVLSAAAAFVPLATGEAEAHISCSGTGCPGSGLPSRFDGINCLR